MKKVLIAEDNPVFTKLLSTLLKKHNDNFDVIFAKDGQEAMEILNKEAVAILVTDIQMPNIDGLTLLAYVNAYHPAIPCLVMTAHETPELLEKLPKDIIRFFRKPFKVEDLAEAIKKALGKEMPTGILTGISVVSFLMMIQMEKKTCLFEVKRPNSKNGLFYFQEGVLYDAIYGNQRGDEAAIKIITKERAEIHFKKLPQKKIAKGIKRDLKTLIQFALKDAR